MFFLMLFSKSRGVCVGGFWLIATATCSLFTVVSYDLQCFPMISSGPLWVFVVCFKQTLKSFSIQTENIKYLRWKISAAIEVSYTHFSTWTVSKLKSLCNKVFISSEKQIIIWIFNILKQLNVNNSIYSFNFLFSPSWWYAFVLICSSSFTYWSLNQ